MQQEEVDRTLRVVGDTAPFWLPGLILFLATRALWRRANRWLHRWTYDA